MQIHQLSRRHKNTKRPNVGRGGTRGKTSGRGHKGQKARAGHRIRPEIRDTIKKFPKLRGYRVSSRPNPTAVNLKDLEEHFKAGEEVTPEILLEKGLVRREKGSVPEVKVLGTGTLTKKLTIKGARVSKAARLAIEKAGGEVVQ